MKLRHYLFAPYYFARARREARQHAQDVIDDLRGALTVIATLTADTGRLSYNDVVHRVAVNTLDRTDP